MRVLVYGGRNYSNLEYTWSLLDQIHKDVGISCLIDGAARGADTLGHKWALHNSIETLRLPAEWNKYGKFAGFKRNKQMLDEGLPDIAVQLAGGAGTGNMRSLLDNADILVIEE